LHGRTGVQRRAGLSGRVGGSLAVHHCPLVVRSRVRRRRLLCPGASSCCAGAAPGHRRTGFRHAAVLYLSSSLKGRSDCSATVRRPARLLAVAPPWHARMTRASAGAGRLRCTCLAPIVPWPPLCAGAGVATRSTGRRRRTRTGGRRRGGRHAGRPGTHRARPRTYASSRGPTSRLLSSNVQCQHHPILMVIMPAPAPGLSPCLTVPSDAAATWQTRMPMRRRIRQWLCVR